MLTKAPWNSKTYRERVTYTMFRSFNVPVIYLAIQTATAQRYARGFVRQAFNGIPEIVEVTDENLTSTPTSINWSQFGATTHVKDQGQCGSCWAYSTFEGIEFAVYMAQRVLEVLAVLRIILCDKTDWMMEWWRPAYSLRLRAEYYWRHLQ